MSSFAKCLKSSCVIFETNTKLAVTVKHKLLLLEIDAPKFEFVQNKSHQFSSHFAMTSVISCVILVRFITDIQRYNGKNTINLTKNSLSIIMKSVISIELSLTY